MAKFALETSVERTACLHTLLPVDLHGLQVHIHRGAAGADGEAGQVVQEACNRSNYFDVFH